ncbi:hypothetical protein IL306_013840 [Fusarium sp. DS 682]|nr:hypothetical protein IL306_013840 [Fusarium sp. DS 682]
MLLALEEVLEKSRCFISRIYLHVDLQPNIEGETYEAPMPSIWGTPLPDTLKKIVRGEILSHIDSFTVEFDPGQFEIDGWWGDGFSGGIYVFHDEETWDEILQERELIWRSQYNEVMKDISANHNITNFRFSNLLPKIASAWETPEWGDFLGRLTDLEISVFGGDNGAGWCASTMPGFYDFIDKLPSYIMRKAINVYHLSLESSLDGLFGAPDGIPLPLKDDHLPRLRSLRLKNMWAGPELLDLLKNRGDCFEDLELHDCMCDSSWGEFWRSIRENNVSLRRISVVQDEAPPLMWEEKYNGDYSTIHDSEHAARIRDRRKEDESLVLWRYASVCDKYGCAVELPDDNVENFEKGDDQREYLKLLKVLEERNKRAR